MMLATGGDRKRVGHTVVNVDGGGLNEKDGSEEEDGGFGKHYKKNLVRLR